MAVNTWRAGPTDEYGADDLAPPNLESAVSDSPYRTLMHMALVGTAAPISSAALEKAEVREGAPFPDAFKALLSTFGVGVMLGRFKLLDPTTPLQPNGWQDWKRILAEENPTSGLVTRWYTDDWDFADLVMFAITPEGGGLAWRLDEKHPGKADIWFLDSPSATGRVHWLASSLEEAIGRLIQGRYLGDISDIMAPSPGGEWSYPPTFLAADAPTLAAEITEVIDALRQDHEQEARAHLDHACGLYSGYDVSAVLLERLSGVRPAFEVGTINRALEESVRVPAAPDLGIEKELHREWLELGLAMHIGHHPQVERDTLDLLLFELETREDPRVSFEAAPPVEISARTRDKRHEDLLVVDIRNASGQDWVGELQLLEFDSEGDLQEMRAYAVELGPREEIVHVLRGVPATTRVDLELIAD